jgi:hypothetical protein
MPGVSKHRCHSLGSGILFCFLISLLLAACQPTDAQPVAEIVTEGVMIEPEGFIQRIHDPVIAKENDT